MKQTIGIMLAVAFFGGGLLETQSNEVSVLKLYGNGTNKLERIKEEQSDGVPNTWFHINHDVELLEIIYLQGRSLSGDGVTQFSLNGCVNLTNIVVCAEPNGKLIFRLGDDQMAAKRLKIRAVKEQEFHVFHYNEQGNAVFPTDDFWSAPIDRYAGVWLASEQVNRRGKMETKAILAWSGAWMQRFQIRVHEKIGTHVVKFWLRPEKQQESGWRVLPNDKDSTGFFSVTEPR